MTFAWLSIDLVLIVALAFCLPLAFLYVIRQWLKQTEDPDRQRPTPSSETTTGPQV